MPEVAKGNILRDEQGVICSGCKDDNELDPAKSLVEFSIPLDRAFAKEFLKKKGYNDNSFEEIPVSVFIERSLSEGEENTMTRYLNQANYLTRKHKN